MRFVKSNRAGKLVIALAVAAVLGLVALMPATAADGEVPFAARLAGSAAFASRSTVEFHGAGQATHLGTFVGGGVAILGSPSESCPTGAPGIPNVHT
jgi:hypothetical protein